MTDSLLGGVPQPHQTIDCQSLLKDGCVHSGWLRKRSKVHLFKLTRNLVPWFQKYVVLSRGCLYQFNSEVALHPKAAMSLFGFNSVVRAGEISQADRPWAFKLVHVDGTDKKTFYFSAASQDEMTEWMKRIKEQMIWVNKRVAPSVAPYEDVNIDNQSVRSFSTIETGVYPEDATERVSAELRRHHIDELEDDEKQDYNQIEEWRMTLPSDNMIPPTDRPLPPTPGAEGAASRSSPATRPPARLPSPGPRTPALMPSQPLSPPAVSSRPAVPAKPQDVNVGGGGPPKRLPAGAVNVMGLGADAWPVRTPPTPPARNDRRPSEPLPTSPAASAASPPPTALKPPTRERQLPPTPVPNQRTRNNNQEHKHSNNTNDIFRDDDVFWSAVLFESTDKDASHKVIQELAKEGVYLIRPGKEGKVLVVYAEGAVRKYRITQIDNLYSITKSVTFHSIHTMVKHYTKENLPGRDAKLTIPYTDVHAYECS